jgi:hypothetical protein
MCPGPFPRRLLRLASLAAVGTSLTVLPAGAPNAQLPTTRGLFLSPAPDTGATSTFFGRTDFWGDIQHNGGHRASVMAWNYKLGLQVELLQVPHGLSVEGLLGHELSATPDNGVGFDPAGAVWEERIGLRLRRPFGDVQLDLFQRCRHEVDNGTPLHPGRDSVRVDPTSRVLVVGGVRLASTTRDALLGRLSLRAQLEAEVYTASSDHRTPRGNAAPDWRNAMGLGAVAARARWAWGDHRSAYVRAWGAGMRFRAIAPEQPWQWSHRVEFGVHSAGRAGGLALFWAHEQTFDDGMRPVPRRFSGSFLGVRIAGAALE